MSPEAIWKTVIRLSTSRTVFLAGVRCTSLLKLVVLRFLFYSFRSGGGWMDGWRIRSAAGLRVKFGEYTTRCLHKSKVLILWPREGTAKVQKKSLRRPQPSASHTSSFSRILYIRGVYLPSGAFVEPYFFFAGWSCCFVRKFNLRKVVSDTQSENCFSNVLVNRSGSLLESQASESELWCGSRM